MSMGPRQSTFNTYVNDHIGAPMLTTQRAKYGAQPTQEAQSNNQPRGRNGQLHEYVRWGEDDVQSLEHNLKDIDDKRDRIHHIHKSWDSYLSESNQNNQYSENSAEYHDSETVEYNSEIAENDFDSKEYNSEIEATGYDAETVENDYKTIDYDSKIEEFDSEAVENNLDISKDSNEQQEVENNKMTIKGNRSPRIYRNRVQTEKPDKYDNRNETSELKTQVKSGFGRKMMLMKLTPAGQNDVTAGVKSVQNISQTLILIVQFVIGILFI
ncbi:unnamed protein product [Owenia fusiformis]|uniref:Uncharacterized protein n=1 Tax=Owenia fusiformis TaxID=6347 RepID=A0A8J1U1M5_OWEFU|nr:unnamed protein product [Owenia fusiformis]